ncbi:MAG: membrane dipeptidase [Solirubrobacteraceae bacterium]
MSADRFVVRSGDGYAATARTARDGEPFRLQATALGRYLLYGRDRTALSRRGDGIVSPRAPGPAGDWIVSESGDAFTLQLLGGSGYLRVRDGGALHSSGSAGGDVGRFRMVPTEGCATFPEAELNVTGAAARGPSPDAEVVGLVDDHVHPMAFEFLGGSMHCGRPWSPYGVEQAMVDCPDHGLQGAAAVFENFLSGKPVVGFHDPVGWPTFKDWPRHDSLTHEGMYHRWIERAYRGGLRLMVNHLVDNGVLCRIYPIRRRGCDEMDTIRTELKDTLALQDYIDAQSGGPGKGWFRIVRSPAEARRTINEGKLAVILGMENSEAFNCALPGGVPGCTRRQLDERLDEMHRMGVRTVFPVHKFDNALGGTAGDADLLGALTNIGNFVGTGHFLRLQRCEEGRPSDVYDLDVIPRLDAVVELLTLAGVQGALPVYPDGPLCNPRGLTDLGRHLVGRLMDKGMLVEVDHMSVRTRDDTLALIEKRGYSGVISSHSWSDGTTPRRIYRLGGFVGPYAGASKSFADAWRELRPQADDRFLFGIGFGSDINGFGAQGGPRTDNASNPVVYPFRSADGAVTVDRNRAGSRTFDINHDGVAQYGLYPDWVEDLRKIAGRPIVDDLLRGAEAYLQTWERAEGVPATRCQAAGTFSRTHVGPLRPGESVDALLRRAGQPAARPERAFRYCIRDRGGRDATATAVFDERGRTALAVTDARRHRASKVRVGSRIRAVRRVARRVANGIWVRRATPRRAKRSAGARVVYVTRKGRVRAMAIAASGTSIKASSLRRSLRLAGVR